MNMRRVAFALLLALILAAGVILLRPGANYSHQDRDALLARAACHASVRAHDPEALARSRLPPLKR